MRPGRARLLRLGRGRGEKVGVRGDGARKGPQMDHRIVSHIDDLGHRHRGSATGDHIRSRDDPRRVARVVDERPRQAGVILGVLVDVDMDGWVHRKRSSGWKWTLTLRSFSQLNRRSRSSSRTGSRRGHAHSGPRERRCRTPPKRRRVRSASRRISCSLRSPPRTTIKLPGARRSLRTRRAVTMAEARRSDRGEYRPADAARERRGCRYRG